MAEDLMDRSRFLFEVFKRYVKPSDSILEIGCGDGRNIHFLRKMGYARVEGIDKIYGRAIEDIRPKKYDVIFSMSALFLIPETNSWVFEKIGGMVRKLLITIEGETTKGEVIGRNYKEVFEPFGFEELEHLDKVFNEFGHLRVLKKI